MRKSSVAALSGLALALGAAGLSVNAAAQTKARAHTASAISGNDNAKLHSVHASGSTLLEEGSATGPLPGHVRAYLHIGATLSGSFTIYTRYGSVSGHGSATPHGSGVEQSFSGSLVVTGGSGRYAHARGRGGLYGTYNRRTYAVELQPRGTIYY
jgi:hypothetical protein